jgi:glycerol-3-phosphate dehydrogenase
LSRTSPYDVAVIGGGIHGAGIAQAAAASGYRVVVLEQTALAAGTSSRSSKLIHGGLRYLETGQLGLVRESLRERALLLKLAPRLVHPAPFYIPVYTHGKRSPLTIHIGLLLYAMLSGLGPLSRFNRLPASQWSQLEGLNTDNLRAVFRYWDAQTDDAELTRVVMRSAQVLGAELLCPAKLVTAIRSETGYRVRYQAAETIEEIDSRFLVNAAGPWANTVLASVAPGVRSLPVDLVQGTHIVVNSSVHDKVFYLEAPSDGRAVFVMPWKNNTTLIGTTEHLYTGLPENVTPLDDEVEYLLNTLHHYFPGRSDQVLEKFAGLRVLPQSTRSVFHRTRETILHIDSEHPRLMTVYGGKLTGYRATAEKVMRAIQPIIGARRQKVKTSEIYLTRTDNRGD